MEELDIKEIFKIFWNKKVLILSITVIFLLVGFIYSSFFVTPMYKATTTIILVQSSDASSGSDKAITQSDITLNQKLVPTYSELIKKRIIATPVIQNLGLNISESDFAKKVTVSSDGDTELIDISVVDENPYEAAKIANEVAKVFGEEIKGIYNIQNVSIVDEALVPSSAYNVKPVKNMVIFAFIGFVISLITTFLMFYFDTTIKSKEDIEKAIGLPILTVVPEYED